jgi:hypothetical protein
LSTASGNGRITDILASVTLTASVEQASKLEERVQAHARFLDEFHARAERAVEHPSRNLKTVFVLMLGSVELADQHPAVCLRCTSYDQLLAEQWMPAVAYASDFGFVGIVLLRCT